MSPVAYLYAYMYALLLSVLGVMRVHLSNCYRRCRLPPVRLGARLTTSMIVGCCRPASSGMSISMHAAFPPRPF